LLNEGNPIEDNVIEWKIDEFNAILNGIY